MRFTCLNTNLVLPGLGTRLELCRLSCSWRVVATSMQETAGLVLLHTCTWWRTAKKVWKTTLVVG